MKWEIPILIFHHVSPAIDYYTNTPPPVFAQQLGWVAEKYRFWTAAEAYRAFQEGQSPAGHCVITFDDGYEDNFLYARPVLDAYGAKATFFILADFIDRGNEWNAKCGYRAWHMSLEQLRSMRDEGHEIGGHGLSHRKLTELALSDLEHELLACRLRLTHLLDHEICSFAYPFGVCDSRVVTAAGKHYAVAFSTVKSSERDWHGARHALRRVYLPVGATRDEVFAIMDGSLEL
jgi:peptidoglycan/xylan/chitin deacetylase (PgdA/CDA1 family)